MIGLACATISCDGFDDNDFQHSFRIMPEVGFKFIEFNAWYPRGITPAKIRELKERCVRHNLQPACIHGMGFGADNPRDLSKDVGHKLRIIDAAVELGCRRVSFTGAGRGKAGGLAAIITVLKQIAPAAAEQDVLICLENHADNNLETIDDYAQIFDAVESPSLGVCLDTGHFDASGVNMDELIDRFQLKINHIHVKENKGFGRKEFVRFGQGTTDNFHVIDRMLALGYEGFITVELSPQEDTSTIPEDLRLAWQMFKKYESV
jgi:sugar phosphate isomerase/epimerase